MKTFWIFVYLVMAVGLFIAAILAAFGLIPPARIVAFCALYAASHVFLDLARRGAKSL